MDSGEIPSSNRRNIRVDRGARLSTCVHADIIARRIQLRRMVACSPSSKLTCTRCLEALSMCSTVPHDASELLSPFRRPETSGRWASMTSPARIVTLKSTTLCTGTMTSDIGSSATVRTWHHSCFTTSLSGTQIRWTVPMVPKLPFFAVPFETFSMTTMLPTLVCWRTGRKARWDIISRSDWQRHKLLRQVRSDLTEHGETGEFGSALQKLTVVRRGLFTLMLGRSKSAGLLADRTGGGRVPLVRERRRPRGGGTAKNPVEELHGGATGCWASVEARSRVGAPINSGSSASASHERHLQPPVLASARHASISSSKSSRSVNQVEMISPPCRMQMVYGSSS
mmetsp:Transcript_22510/g.64787  ORF Transcript_22510/g.64787 Transcript_22510/m.64787 type:complete len:340 (-) Transcript_22510:59-1078(-)